MLPLDKKEEFVRSGNREEKRGAGALKLFNLVFGKIWDWVNTEKVKEEADDVLLDSCVQDLLFEIKIMISFSFSTDGGKI